MSFPVQPTHVLLPTSAAAVLGVLALAAIPTGGKAVICVIKSDAPIAVRTAVATDSRFLAHFVHEEFLFEKKHAYARLRESSWPLSNPSDVG